MVRDFFKVYNESFSTSVYNFVPFTDEEIQEEAKSSIPFISDKVSCILFDEDENIAAFGISFPSISKALQKAKGRLFPFGWIHLLKAMFGEGNVSGVQLGQLGGRFCKFDMVDKYLNIGDDLPDRGFHRDFHT